jgi:hypothetical protein
MDIQELRRLHGAATPGFYHYSERNGLSHIFIANKHKANTFSSKDAAAIVALHNAAPALLDAADELARVKAVLGSELAYVTVKERIVSNVPFVTDAHYAATAALAALRELIGANV